MFAPDDGDAGVYEPDAGVLIVERFLRAQLDLAVAAGAAITTDARVDRIELGASGVRVWAGDVPLDAERLVVARGPWSGAPIAGMPPLPIPLRVERQVQFWLAPLEPALFEPDRMPVFLRFGHAHAFYGLPHVARDGVKVCQHHGGLVTEPDALDRTPHASDEAPVRAFVEHYLPRAAGRTLQAEVCTYTNTPDEHFVIGAHPSHPRVLVMAGFSGHGFKLAPAMGELIAELATRGTTTLDASLFDPRRFVGQAS
jgi:sarcosine oxidase